jgi:hypothetical protein
MGSRGFPIPVASIVRDAVGVGRGTDVDHNVDMTGSNDRTVPVTTPTANRPIIAFDHRRASASSSGSARRRPSHSIPRTSAGNASGFLSRD